MGHALAGAGRPRRRWPARGRRLGGARPRRRQHPGRLDDDRLEGRRHAIRVIVPPGADSPRPLPVRVGRERRRTPGRQRRAGHLRPRPTASGLLEGGEPSGRDTNYEITLGPCRAGAWGGTEPPCGLGQHHAVEEPGCPALAGAFEAGRAVRLGVRPHPRLVVTGVPSTGLPRSVRSIGARRFSPRPRRAGPDRERADRGGDDVARLPDRVRHG